MSAFAVVLDTLGDMLEPGLLEPVMARLAHRGPDGQHCWSSGATVMGHRHFWTTSEDVGEIQPLSSGNLPFHLVFDGRIDNRQELLARLSIPACDESLFSDASLVLRAFAIWGEDCLLYLIGEFAFALYDEREHSLFCARDPVGTRTLFFTRTGSHFIIVSEPWAALAVPGVRAEADDVAAAHFFSFQYPYDGQTLFKGIRELLPGHALKFSAGDYVISRFWQSRAEYILNYKDDRDYSQHFLELMDESIRVRMRSLSQPAIMMSGGLDSTTIASLAARQISPNRLTTYSYVFDEFQDCDERIYIHEIQRKYDTRSVEIVSDDFWPFYNWPDWPASPSYPISNIYWPLRHRVYQQASQDGIHVMLDGDFGDDLYYPDVDWFSALLIDGHLRLAWKEMAHHVSSVSLRKYFMRAPLRRLARQILDKFPGGDHIGNKPTSNSWLSAESCLLLSKVNSPRYNHVRYNALFDPLTAQISSVNPFSSFFPALELRHPCRDIRLIEFMLALPPYLLYRFGCKRFILREAMRGILPEKIRLRVGKTHFLPLFFHGREQRRDELKLFFESPNSPWKRFVNLRWLLERWDAAYIPDHDGAEKVVPWLCLAYTLWYRLSINDSFSSI